MAESGSKKRTAQAEVQLSRSVGLFSVTMMGLGGMIGAGIFALSGIAAGAAAVGGTGMLAVWMVILLGFFNSMMYPTIFALSVEGLGPQKKTGASLLVMSIVGGALLPPLMGLISDRTNIQMAFLVPIVCYAYVFYFAVHGHRPSKAAAVATA